MPTKSAESVSKSQQRFMGMVHAAQKGELKNPGPKVREAAESMSEEEARKFAETKHEGLPEKVDTKEASAKLDRALNKFVGKMMRKKSAISGIAPRLPSKTTVGPGPLNIDYNNAPGTQLTQKQLSGNPSYLHEQKHSEPNYAPRPGQRNPSYLHEQKHSEPNLSKRVGNPNIVQQRDGRWYNLDTGVYEDPNRGPTYTERMLMEDRKLEDSWDEPSRLAQQALDKRHALGLEALTAEDRAAWDNYPGPREGPDLAQHTPHYTGGRGLANPYEGTFSELGVNPETNPGNPRGVLTGMPAQYRRKPTPAPGTTNVKVPFMQKQFKRSASVNPKFSKDARGRPPGSFKSQEYRPEYEQRQGDPNQRVRDILKKRQREEDFGRGITRGKSIWDRPKPGTKKQPVPPQKPGKPQLPERVEMARMKKPVVPPQKPGKPQLPEEAKTATLSPLMKLGFVLGLIKNAYGEPATMDTTSTPSTPSSPTTSTAPTTPASTGSYGSFDSSGMNTQQMGQAQPQQQPQQMSPDEQKAKAEEEEKETKNMGSTVLSAKKLVDKYGPDTFLTLLGLNQQW